MRPLHLPSSRPASAVAGFTLMEVLVVIVIIGVIVSAATLSFGILGGDRESEDEARRFWALLQQAREEAELQTADIGVYVAASSYEFLRMDPRKRLWVPIAGDVLYFPRQLPEGLRFRVWLESREIVLKPQLPDRSEDEQDEDEDDEEKSDEKRIVVDRTNTNPNGRQENPPQIMVLSSGEIMPFELQIERDGAEAHWRVVAQPDTDLRVERRNDDRTWTMVAQTKAPQEDEEDKT
jgi:general secretion pathway protein H